MPVDENFNVVGDTVKAKAEKLFANMPRGLDTVGTSFTNNAAHINRVSFSQGQQRKKTYLISAASAMAAAQAPIAST